MEHEIKKILIIRFRRVGDSVLSMALCHSLKLSFPEAEIHFVINKGIAPLYRNHPDIDRVITFSDAENHGMTYVKKVYGLMKSTRYDVIIDMRSTLKTLLFSLFSLHTPYRIGRKKWYGGGLLNYRLETPEGADRVQSNLHLMDPLAAEGKLIKDEHFPLYITSAEKADYQNYLQSKGIDLRRPVVLVAVATRIAGKAWPRERMVTILRRIIDNYHPQMVFNYSGEIEAEAARQYYEALGRDPHIHIDIEAKDLRQLCALCACSSFFFGNEGGPRHISQAFEVPSFAIYPPGIDKHFWLPGQSERYQGISPDDSVSPDVQSQMSYQERMSLITVDDVWAGLQPMLDQFLRQ
jgi:ADP-heptose:LPS heptosyltransferase